MLKASLLGLLFLVPGLLATPVERDVPDLYNMKPGEPALMYNAVTGIKDLPANSDWFTAALIAYASATPEELLTRIESDGNDAKFTLMTPDTTGSDTISVKWSDAPARMTDDLPWWGAGFMQAVKQKGLFNGKDGVKSDGTWTQSTAVAGLAVLASGSGTAFGLETKDLETIKKIARWAKDHPITVTTDKGLVTADKGFKGDTSDGPKVYALLGIKEDGGIMIKGNANIRNSDGTVVDPQDFVKHVKSFSFAQDIRSEFQVKGQTVTPHLPRQTRAIMI